MEFAGFGHVTLTVSNYEARLKFCGRRRCDCEE